MSVSFDAAAEEIWPTLVTGATLVLRSDDMLGSADMVVASRTGASVSVPWVRRPATP